MAEKHASTRSGEDCSRCAELAEALRFARGQIVATYDELMDGKENVDFFDMVGFELAMKQATAALGDEMPRRAPAAREG